MTVVTGCGEQTPPPSAGARPLDSTAVMALWGSVPANGIRDLAELASVPVGGRPAGEGPEFHRVAGAAITSNGLVVVGDAGSRQLVAIDSTGKVVWTQGGAGGGPGEYQRITSVAPHPSGGVGVLDGQAHRVTVISMGAEVLQTIPLPAETRGRVRHPEWLADGTVMIGVDGGPPPPSRTDTLFRLPLHLLRLAPEGGSVDTIVTTEGAERFRTQVLGLPAVGPPAYARDQGYGVIDSLLVFGPDDSGRIHIRRPGGERHAMVEPEQGTEPMSQEDWEVFRQRWEERFADQSPEMRAGFDTVLSRMPVPDERPLVGAIRVDQAGWIWVPRGHASIEEPGLSWVLDPDGVVREMWRFEPDLTLLAASRELIVTQGTGELGVEVVRVHRRR